MNRFLLISVGTLSCILLGVLFGGYSASAASQYDTMITTVDELRLTSAIDTSLTTDFSEDWYNEMAQAYQIRCDKRHSSGEYCVGADILKDTQAFNSGSWYVNTNSQRNTYTLNWTSDPNATITLGTVSGIDRVIVTSNSPIYTFSAVFYSPNYDVATEKGIRTNNPNISGQSFSPQHIYVSTFDFIAPTGYEGLFPPETNTEECLRECRIVIAPNFEYEYDDKRITVTDLENDLLPDFEPDEGYTSLGYEIEWSLWKCTVEYDNGLCKNGENELVELKHTTLLEGNTWNNLDYGYYRVEAQYVVQQCYRYPSYPATPDYCFYVDLGTEFGKVYLFEKRSRSINLDGTSGSGNTSDENCDVSGECTPSTVGGLLPCFGPDPPYIQVDGCVKNIFWVVDSLSFSKITIMEIRSNTMQCKQLDTIGGWINRPGITVCPMFPSHVRDVVTPFITLAIGLFLGSFIMRLASRGVR